MNLAEIFTKPQTKKIKINGADVEIRKLTLAEVEELQALHAEINQRDDDGNVTVDPKRQYDVVIKTLCLGIEGFSELPDETVRAIPMETLNKAVDDVLKFSGMGAK